MSLVLRLRPVPVMSRHVAVSEVGPATQATVEKSPCYPVTGFFRVLVVRGGSTSSLWQEGNSRYGLFLRLHRLIKGGGGKNVRS